MVLGDGVSGPFSHYVHFPMLKVVVNNLRYTAAYPAYRIAETYPLRGVNDIMGNYKKIYLPDHNEIHDHNDHRSS